MRTKSALKSPQYAGVDTFGKTEAHSIFLRIKDSLAGAYILREIATQNRLLYQESPSFVKKIRGLVAIELFSGKSRPAAKGQRLTVVLAFRRGNRDRTGPTAIL